MPAQKRSYEAADANPDAEEASSKKPATMYTRRARRPLQNIEPRPTEENVTGFAEPTQQAGSISSPLRGDGNQLDTFEHGLWDLLRTSAQDLPFLATSQVPITNEYLPTSQDSSILSVQSNRPSRRPSTNQNSDQLVDTSNIATSSEGGIEAATKRRRTKQRPPKVHGEIGAEDDQLVYLDPTNGKWHNAVIHDSIRGELIEQARSDDGDDYNFPDPKGLGQHDETSYEPSQKAWGPDRANRPALLTRFDPPNTSRKDRRLSQRPDWLRYRGMVVLDCNEQPLYDWPNLPLTLSSETKGWKLEALFRLFFSRYRCFQLEDILARMPKAKVLKDGGTKNLGRTTNFISMRMGRFRETAGLVSWNSHRADGKDEMIRQIRVEQGMSDNSTENLPDFNPLDIARIRKPGLNKHLQNARKNITQEKRESRQVKEEAKLEKYKKSLEHQRADETSATAPSETFYATESQPSPSYNDTGRDQPPGSFIRSQNSTHSFLHQHLSIEKPKEKSRKRKSDIDSQFVNQSNGHDQCGPPALKKKRREIARSSRSRQLSRDATLLDPSIWHSSDNNLAATPLTFPDNIQSVKKNIETFHEEQQARPQLLNAASVMQSSQTSRYHSNIGQPGAFRGDFDPVHSAYTYIDPAILQRQSPREENLSTFDPLSFQYSSSGPALEAPAEQRRYGHFDGVTEAYVPWSIYPTAGQANDAGFTQEDTWLRPSSAQYSVAQPGVHDPLPMGLPVPTDNSASSADPIEHSGQDIRDQFREWTKEDGW